MRNHPLSRTRSSGASKPLCLVVAVVAGIALTPAALHADDDVAEDAQERAAVAASTLTLAQALETAGKEFPGARVIKAEVDTENGVPSYVIDVEKDGVQRLVFDLRTGQMTKTAGETDDRGDDDNGGSRSADDNGSKGDDEDEEEDND
jgi:hypothetical protein